MSDVLIPRPYQVEGIAFLAGKKRAMLRDAPGLGKTLQASEAATKPVLVCSPSYLTDQWAEFIRNQFPDDRIAFAQGSRVQRTEALNTPADWYIINHQMLRTYDVPVVNTFIVDESHHMKSHKAEQSQDALVVALQVPNVFLLTATPIIREPDDLYMQLRLIAPNVFRSYEKFVSTYCNVVQSPFARMVVGLRKGTDLGKVLAKYSLGRTYEDVKLQLPDLIEANMLIYPERPFVTRYRAAKIDYRLDDRVLNSPLEVLRELRRLTVCEQKVSAIADLVEDSPGCVVVFCWFRETARILSERLRAPLITGDVKPNDRRVVALQQHKCIVATIAALSEGVDLSFAKTVIFAEQDYTPGRMQQAVSRVHRWTTDLAPVRVFYAMMKGTIDEIIHRCVDRRISSAMEVLRLALANDASSD
jgi:SWI/SNF-related matrix-associated actin-dependent regulator 1 of chromatin subfamily A